MAEISIKELPKSEVELTFEVSVDEAQPYLDDAVKDLSTARPLPGFRPGRATYDDVKRVHGEMLIWETALEKIVRSFYVRTVLEKKLSTVGSPHVSVDRLVPGQSIKFKATAPVEPAVVTYPDVRACRIVKKKKDITEEQIINALDEMRRMRSSETRVDRSATMEDLVLIDLEMKKDGVPVDGGTGRDYRIALKEDHYIPGFTQELLGVKEGEERTFSLPFPAEHYQKHLAGHPIAFTAKVKGVFERQMPPLDDAFAARAGLSSVDELRSRLKENLTAEETRRADEAAEIEMLDVLVDAASFSEIPEILVNEEVRRMVHELEQGITEQGMAWADYLSSIKKNISDLKLEFVPQAIRRIKAAVFIKDVAKRESIAVSDKALDEEIDRILEGLRNADKETRERVSSPEYRDYIAVQMRNRQVMEWLKEQCLS